MKIIYKCLEEQVEERMDDRGNIIFYGNIDYLTMMKGVLPCLQGSDKKLSDNYNILKNISKINTNVIYDNIINEKKI